MTRLPVHRGWQIFVSVGLSVIALCVVVGLVAAQSQLPGNRLTVDPGQDLRPAWSPDGASIAFFSSRSGNYDIWVMNADGSDQRQLTTEASDDRRPTWSPDGTQVVFDSDRLGGRNIWVMNADGSNQRALTQGTTEDSFPAWSPDGSQIAYFAYDGEELNLWVMEADGNNPRAVTTSMASSKRNECTFACHMPEWSPDSRQLAFTSGSQTPRIWMVDLANQNVQPLSPGVAREHFPYWLPDGRILFLSEHINQSQETINDVWVMDADGQNATMVYDNIPHGGPLMFQPDGRTITFHSPRFGSFDIYSIILGEVESTPQPMQVTLVPDLAISGPIAEAATPTPSAMQTATVATSTPALATVLSGGAMPWLAGGAIGALVVAGLSALYFFTRRGRAG